MCSLILNEILTNIFKYAFVSDRYLRVDIRKKNDEVSMIIADNGPGLSEKEEDKKKQSLGMKIIKSLAGQINASIEIDSSVNNGVCYTIKYKV